ncbi:unnamed protein product, partial [Polarella glacialis]
RRRLNRGSCRALAPGLSILLCSWFACQISWRHSHDTGSLAFVDQEDHQIRLDPVTGPEREQLPKDIVPVRYDLELELNPERSSSFQGRLAVSVQVPLAAHDAVAFYAISLNARNLSIAKESVIFRSLEGSDEEFLLQEIIEDRHREVVTLKFSTPLPAGKGLLSLSYAGRLSADMAGLYRSEHKGPTGKVEVMAMTQFEAIDARRMLPCWDEPSKKAIFSLALIIPEHLTAVSNMPASSEAAAGKGKRQVRFLDTPKMSTYLLALAVGQFDSIQQVSQSGTLIRVLTARGQSEGGRFALDVAVRALDFYGQYFEVPYPLPKLDMLAAPDFAAGAMENWGLVIYREVDLLCNATTVGVARKMRIATVVAHELAHMWFGNLVTMEWWDQLWLNEGFANWMQTHAVDVLFPEWDIWDQYIVQEQARALSLDALRSSHPIEVPIRRAQEVDEVFDAISYSKGGSVVRMISAFLGPDLFRSGLALYMKRHAYSNTGTADLWKCWEEVSGRPISAIMDSWTSQTGFPVLVVDSTGSSLRGFGSLDLKQHWFLADGSVEAGDEQKLWQIPLLPGSTSGALAVSSQPELFQSSQGRWTAPSGAAWLKLNFGQVAPYRVLYASAELRSALVAAVRSGEMGAKDRIGLLLDSMALARQGSLPSSEVVSLISAFRGEVSPHVWEALSSVVVGLHRSAAFLSPGAAWAQRFETAVAEMLVRPALTRFGWAARVDESDMERQRRSLVVGLASRFLRHDPAVLGEARARFEAWLHAPEAAEALPDDLKGSVFRLVLANAK